MSTAETSPAVKAADATDIDRLATHAIIDGHAVCNPTLKAIYQGHNGEVTCKRCIATPIPKEDPMTASDRVELPSGRTVPRFNVGQSRGYCVYDALTNTFGPKLPNKRAALAEARRLNNELRAGTQ